MPLLQFQSLLNSYDYYNAFDTEQLYKSLGWDDLISKPEWANTCAIRMSLALLESGVVLPGRVKIKKGGLKGKWVEPGQNRLSNWLLTHLGQPQVFPFKPEDSTGPQVLLGQQGITSFMRIPGYAGGHIDLLKQNAEYLECSRSCYFDAEEVRFWKID